MRRFINVVLLVLIVILLILVARSTSAEWYSGIVHVHSTFSDGDRTPGMLKNAAQAIKCDFLIVTDHVEQINNKKKTLPRTDLFTDDFGYDNYIKQFSVTKPLLCLAGTEITTSEGSHVLALVNVSKVFQANLSKFDQQEVINRLNELGALPVAAHPNIKKYQFNQDKTDGIAGIEFFNEDADGYKKTLEWYLKLIADGKSPFVTAGCDSHSSLDPTKLDLKRWQRRTMVYSDRVLTPEILFEDITYGQTYAANNGAYFKDINYIVGKCYWKVDRPKFQINIGFSKKTTASKVLRIYRDGQLAEGSVKSLPVGLTQYSYACEDKAVNPGKHKYVIEVEGCLITSPICLDVQGVKKLAKPKVAVKPILIPKSNINSSLYHDSIDEPIKADLRRLWQTKEKTTHLVITKKDQDYIRNYEADRRVLMALLELAKTHTLAVRMKIGYQNERCWVSRETALDLNYGPNISAHFTAQAYDIFCADGVEIAWQVSFDPIKKAKARQKIQQLIREIIAIGRKDSNLLPTQMMIYGWNDVNVFTKELNSYYGPASQRGNSGMWANDRMWDRIHIGY